MSDSRVIYRELSIKKNYIIYNQRGFLYTYIYVGTFVEQYGNGFIQFVGVEDG
jgi:hypothetical protein